MRAGTLNQELSLCSPEPFLVIDQNAKYQDPSIVAVNPAFGEAFGDLKTVSELVRFCLSDSERFLRHLTQQEPGVRRARFELIDRSGNLRSYFIAVSFRSKTDDLSDRPSSVIQLTDVTEMFEHTKMLEEVKQRSVAILKAAGLGSWDWYLGTGRVVYDQGWAKMLGLDLQDLAQDFSVWEKFVHPEDKEKTLRKVQAYLDGDIEIYEARFRMRHKAGHWVWILARAQFSDWESDGTPNRMTGTHYDISDYTRQFELAESIQKNAKIGGWELDALSMKTTWTEETYHIHSLVPGTPTDKIMGIEFFNEEDRGKIAQYVEQCLEGVPYQDRLRFTDAQGSQRWVEVNGEPIFDAQGAVVKLRGTIQDVTELFEEKESLQSLVNSFDDLVFEVSDQGSFINIHAQDESKLVASKDQLLGANLTNYFSAEVSQTITDAMKECRALGRSVDFVYRSEGGLSDQEASWFRCRVSSQMRSEPRYTVLVSDITKEKRWDFLEQKYLDELNAVNNRLKTLLRQSPTIVFECLFDDDWTMKFISDYVEEVTGFEAKDFLRGRKTFASLIHPEDQEKVSGYLQSNAQKGQAYELEYRIIHRDGEIRWIWERGLVRAEDNHLVGVLFDITEKKKAEDQLRAIASELDHFFGMAPDPLCIARVDGSFLKVNPAMSELLGFEIAELENKSFLPLVHPDDLKKTGLALEQLDQGHRVAAFENRYRCKDGQYRILSWTAVLDRENSLIYAVARDLTDVIQARLELEQVQQAIEQSAIVAITDRSGKIVSVNTNFLKISGYNQEELLGQNHRMLKSGVHPPAFYQDLWRTISQGRTWEGEITNRRKDGSLYDVYTVISPLTDSSGKIARYLAIRFDVTQIKASERKYREAERIARMGSWTYSLDEQESYWSEEMYSLLWRAPDNGVPQRDELFELIHPDDRERCRLAATSCTETHQSFRLRLRLAHQKETWLEVIGRAEIDQMGHLKSLSGTCQDISELVNAEKKLEIERSKSLQSAKLASLGEMSAGVAHEINNPLTIISAGLKVLTRLREDEPKFHEKIQNMKKAIERISKIVLSLRRFSRSANLSDRVWVSLANLVEEVREIAGLRAQRKGVQLQFEGDLEAQIFCNAIEIEQVLINLLNNGIDACANQENGLVRLLVEQGSFDVRVKIIDSGPGFGPEARERLFQPFYTTKEVGDGTGLGLSIVKGILDSHQAEISLNENHSEPTTFTLKFLNRQDNRNAV